MKNKKSIIAVIGVLIILLIIGAVMLLNQNKKPTFKGDISKLYDVSWERGNNTEIEIIYFGSDKHFAYYETSGNPVDDYDLCETYKYKNGVLNLKCYDKNIISKLKVVEVTENKIILDFDGEERTFTRRLED